MGSTQKTRACLGLAASAKQDKTLNSRGEQGRRRKDLITQGSFAQKRMAPFAGTCQLLNRKKQREGRPKEVLYALNPCPDHTVLWLHRKYFVVGHATCCLNDLDFTNTL